MLWLPLHVFCSVLRSLWLRCDATFIPFTCTLMTVKWSSLLVSIDIMDSIWHLILVVRSFRKKEEDQKGSYQPSMHYYNSRYTHLFMWLCLILLLHYLQSCYGNTFLTIIIMIIPSYNITSPKKSLSVHRKEVVKQVVRRRAHCWFFG